MSTLNRTSIVLFGLTVLVRVVFHHMTGFVADDAFITFRYAQNLALGHGFVFNLGERVLGTSTPLFTFILSVSGVIGLDIPRTALMVSLLCAGMTSVIIFRLATLLRFTHWAIVPAVMFIFWPRSIVSDSAGMETTLFTLLILGAVYFHTRRAPINALALATLATLTRLEGVALLGALGVYYIYISRERWAHYCVVPLFLLGPWVAFATYYFGSPIPNSVSGKLALYSRWGTLSCWDTLVYLLAWHHPLGWIATVGALAGGWWLIQKQNWGYLAVFWIVGLILFYTASGARMFFWYPSPIYPLLLLFVAAAIPLVAERWAWLDQRARMMKWVVVSVTAGVLVIASYPTMTYYRGFQQEMNACHRAVATFLKENVQPQELVAAEDIGYMGYYSGNRILDRDGLVSPEVAPYNRSGNYVGLILEFKPGWVVAAPGMPTSPFLAVPNFLSQYTEVQSFSGTACRYTIFKRND
jgi:hypothetical protein